MNDIYLDTSWTLYHLDTTSQPYQKLFTTTQSEEHLKSYAERLNSFLSSTQSTIPRDDFDDEDEKLGTLKECHWTTVPRIIKSSMTSSRQRQQERQKREQRKRQHQNQRSHSVQIVYQKQSYRIILYSPHLLLAKTSQQCLRKIFQFLSESFTLLTTPEPLKFSSPFLQTVLAAYINTLSSLTSASTTDDELNNTQTNSTIEEQENLTRLSLFKTGISNLKLTISFSGPVAPSLKTIDLDIPHESVENLLLVKPVSQPSPPPQTSTIATSVNHNNNNDNNDMTLDAGEKFMSNLSHYITRQTGLKLPLHSVVETNTDSDASRSEGEKPMRLTRVTTAFWVLSVEGKIKFSSRVVESVSGDGTNFEDILRGAGSDLLNAIDDEARSRIQT